MACESCQLGAFDLAENLLHTAGHLRHPKAELELPQFPNQAGLRHWLIVEKAIHGLFPRGQPLKTPRVFGVARRRVVRRQALFNVYWSRLLGNRPPGKQSIP